MSNISLSDGEPITYDLIQQLIQTVNSLDASINGPGKKGYQQISVTGNGFRGINDITILCDTQILDLSEKQTYRFNVQIPGSVFSTPPHVVATIADLEGKKGDVLNAPYATISIGKVTKGQFECRIDIIKSVAKNTQIKVNYIAIGKTSDSTSRSS